MALSRAHTSIKAVDPATSLVKIDARNFELSW